MIPDLYHRIVEWHHNLKIMGHAGCWKILELISWSYWWPNMSQYIRQYCKVCDMCLHMKAQKQKPFGKLHPLPIPKARWDIVSVNFIDYGSSGLGKQTRPFHSHSHHCHGTQGHPPQCSKMRQCHYLWTHEFLTLTTHTVEQLCIGTLHLERGVM